MIEKAAQFSILSAAQFNGIPNNVNVELGVLGLSVALKIKTLYRVKRDNLVVTWLAM